MFLRINWNILLRKKHFTTESITNTNLSRVLGLLDVSAIGKKKNRQRIIKNKIAFLN